MVENSEEPQSNILCSSTSRYLIKRIAGEGRSAKVVIAVNLSTMQEVTIKMLKEEHFAKREIRMLKAVKVLDPEKNNLVHFIEKFKYKGQTCFVFEKLDMNLHCLLNQRKRSLTLNEIRPIANQLLRAFRALKGIKVVHADCKLDNVMLVNHQNEPYRVKLIDFGLSFKSPLKELGMIFQPVRYRAPEVTLGLPCSEAIDMWSLGCMLLFLYLGNHPFSRCEYQKMKALVHMVGLPADHLLRAGKYTHCYFKKDIHWPRPGWWITTPSEYHSSTGIEPKKKQSHIRTLDDLMTLYPTIHGTTELNDRKAFVSLIQGFLEIDPKRRLTPKLALSHSFLTMVHIINYTDSPYYKDALDKMKVLHMDNETFFSDRFTNCEEKEASDIRPSSAAGLVVSQSCDTDKNKRRMCVDTSAATKSAITVNIYHHEDPAKETLANERRRSVKVQSQQGRRVKRILEFFGRVKRLFENNST
nr:PREDICTED: homeodomain-interacting protein kinase 1-like [Paralichthys olivaceus]XP_019951348.1 PREDICTED: homeodomain-interacting protein kinase 1-like [Paralichthys olivaceus]